MYQGHGLVVFRPRDVIGHVVILSVVCGFMWSVDTFFLTGTVTEIVGCKGHITPRPMSSQAYIFPV